MSDFNLTITVVSPWEPTPSITEIGGGSSPGSNININGAGFATAGSVYFNTTPASIISWTETLIIATIPDIPTGVYDVIVDPSGAHNVAIRSFSVTKTDELPNGTMTINSGASLTDSRNVSLLFSVNNMVPTGMRIRNSGEPMGNLVPYSATTQWVLSDGDGLKTVEAELTDGTRGLWLSDTITLSATLPGEIQLTEDDIIIVYGPTVVSVNENAASDVYRKIN